MRHMFCDSLLSISLFKMVQEPHASMEMNSGSPAIVATQAIPIFDLPADLQAVFAAEALNTGYLDSALIIEGLRALSNQRKKRIPIEAFDPKFRTELESLDHDGHMNIQEIGQAVSLLVQKKALNRRLVMLIIVLLFFIIFFLGSIFGLVYYVVDLQKVKC
jgi:hypothetical protein